MSSIRQRTPAARILALAAIVVSTTILTAPPAFAQTAKFVARFTATTTGLNPAASVAMKIDVLRWSTDEEATKLTEAFKTAPDKWADALQAAPSLGYVWTDTSSLGYSVKLARREALPDGGARVVLAIERALGSWERSGWKAAGPLASDYPFTILELHVNRRGVGEGKASLAGKVAVDAALKVPALENYAAAPILLKTVTQTGTTAAP